MKSVIIPLVEQDVPGCDCTISAHKFDAEWSLDLHGYLNREEFAKRLREINTYIRNYPLLSTKQKRYLMYAVAGIAAFVLFFILLIMLTTEYDSIYNITTPTLLFYTVLGVAFPIGQKIIDQMAKHRAMLFSQALRPVLDQLNRHENPTANWKLVWRVVVTHYSIRIDANGNGSVIPIYAEQAELVVEINDALSDLTAHTVRVNLSPTTVPRASNVAPTSFATLSRVSTVFPTSSPTVSRASTINTTYPPRTDVP